MTGINVTCKAFKTHYCKEIRGTRKIEHFNASKILKATAGCFATEQNAILSAKFFMDSLKQGGALFDPYADVEKIEIRFEGENINYVVNANTRLAATRKINALLKAVNNETKFEANKLYYTFDEDLNQKEYFVMRKFKGYIWLAENFGNFNQKRYRVWKGGLDVDKYEYVNISKDVKLTPFNVYVEENDNANTDNAGEESTEVENVTADENIAEDDKLVDPPIETAEVQEEEKMKKVRMVDQPHLMIMVTKGIGREELTFANFKAAYRAFKAIENADNLISVTILHDDENYNYMSAYYKNVYDNEECITAKTGKKDPVNTEYYAEIESVIAEVNAEVENVTSDEEVTADIEEVSVKIKELEKKLASLKSFTPNTDEYMAACIETIKNCYARIAQAEDKLWQFKLEKESYDRDVTALENEIANRKLIDATDEIVMSDAVDASVAAMIDLNSANNFTANLLDAVNAQAETTVDVVPVTFELQNFAADVNIAEDVATIDTAVSNTVIEPADEDDVKTQAYLAEIADIDAQIAALQAKRDAIAQARDKHLDSIIKWAYDKTAKTLSTIKSDFMELMSADGKFKSKIFKDYNGIYCVKYEGRLYIKNYFDYLGDYSTVKQFKAVIRGLVAAIERGDETFIFPEDNGNK